MTLDAEMKRLHGLGLGTSSKQAEPITPDEEALLWTSQQFGTHCVMVLINTVYYYNCCLDCVATTNTCTSGSLFNCSVHCYFIVHLHSVQFIFSYAISLIHAAVSIFSSSKCALSDYCTLKCAC